MNKKIKILYLITGLNTGGAEVVVRNLSENLNKDYFNIIVISIIPLGEIGKKVRENGIKVLSLNIKCKYNLFILWKLFKLIKKEAPDILHTHLFHADILGRIVGRLAGVPKIITTIHNINIGSNIREFLMRMTKNFSDYNVAVAKIVAQNAIDKKMAEKNKLTVIYNGVKVSNLQPTTYNLKPIKIVSVGSLTEQKGYKFLIEAAPLVISCLSSVKFIILGEGSERMSLEKQIKENNLEDKVVLKGNVCNVPDYLAEANIFVMPSLWEGFSVALLEAAAASKVIIATDVGGNAEIIKNETNGFLIKPGNADALAEKIKYVLDLPEEKRKKIGENARRVVGEKFSIEKMVGEYKRLYKI